MFKFVVTKNITELFHRAVLQNDLIRVKLLMEQAKAEAKFNIDDINEDGLTALQFSCFASNLELVRLLVEHGANIKVQDRDGWTLTHAAALGGNVDIVRYLAKLGVQVGCKNDDGKLPIDLATDIPTVIILLKYMLEHGHHDAVQAYLQSHPHLKYEISREVNIAMKMEDEERIERENLPYTSHPTRRNSQNAAHHHYQTAADTLNNNTSLKAKRKVKGAFSTLPAPEQVVTRELIDAGPLGLHNSPQTKAKLSLRHSSLSSLAESDSSSSTEPGFQATSRRRDINTRPVQRTASARSDEYYNYHSHLNRTRMSQRDEEVRRSICLGNIGRLPDSLDRRSAMFYNGRPSHGGAIQHHTLPPRCPALPPKRTDDNEKHQSVRRAASVHYPEVYI